MDKSSVQKKSVERTGVVVVMPAYNAARTLEATYNAIPPGTVDHILLVDDNSSDSTVNIAKSLNFASS